MEHTKGNLETMDTAKARKYCQEVIKFARNTKNTISEETKAEVTEKLFGLLFRGFNIIDKFQAQLRWIPADDPPKKFAWQEYFFVLKDGSGIPEVMQAQQIWLDEGSDVTYYMRIPLFPKETNNETR